MFCAKAPPAVSKKMLTHCPRAGVDRLDFYSTVWMACFITPFRNIIFKRVPFPTDLAPFRNTGFFFCSGSGHCLLPRGSNRAHSGASSPRKPFAHSPLPSGQRPLGRKHQECQMIKLKCHSSRECNNFPFRL